MVMISLGISLCMEKLIKFTWHQIRIYLES